MRQTLSSVESGRERSFSSILNATIATTMTVATEIQSTSTNSSKNNELCPDYFAFECVTTNCCASYHQRFQMLLFTLGLFVLALVIIVIWLGVEFRPSKM